MHQCFSVDCDAAHERAKMIAADSPLRGTDDFRAIEYRFAASQLLRAEGEDDLDKRRTLLDAIRSDPAVDVSLRSIASQRLARMGAASTFELILTPDAGAAPDAGPSDAARVAQLMRSKKPADYAAARAILEPKIYAGTITPDELKSLSVICKAQKDNACSKTIKTMVR